MNKTTKRVDHFCAKHRYAYEWQPMQYGPARAIIYTYNRIDHQEKMKAVRRLKNMRIEEWIYPEGVFEGFIGLRDEEEAQQADAENKAETDRVMNWFHARREAMDSGMDYDAAVRYAESLYPTPKT